MKEKEREKEREKEKEKEEEKEKEKEREKEKEKEQEEEIDWEKEGVLYSTDEASAYVSFSLVIDFQFICQIRQLTHIKTSTEAAMKVF